MYEWLFLYFRILKKMFFEKWKNGKSKSQKSRKSQKNYSEFSYFRVLDFSLWSKSKTRIWDSWKKISEIFKISEFLTWPEKIYRNRAKEKISIIHDQLPHKDRKGQCSKISWTLPIMWYQYLLGTFSASFPWLLAMKFYFLFQIQCLAFRLCSSMIVFYTSLEVVKLDFLENKIRYVRCIFANFIVTFETKSKLMFKKKNGVMCILETQSVTLFFSYFYYPHKLESGNTYGKQLLYIMTCIHREK